MAEDGDASPDVSQRAQSSDRRVAQMQRTRILDAMIVLVAERGFAGASVGSVCAQGKVSRRTFYECFAGLEDCFMAVMQIGLERSGEMIFEAFRREDTWPAGVRAALAALLQFFDAEPQLARAWLVESHAAGRWALEQRERNVTILRAAIVSWWSGPELTISGRSPPLAAEGVMASVLGVIEGHMLSKDDTPLVELLGPLTGLAVGPFLRADEVVREVRLAEGLAREIQSKRCLMDDPTVPAVDVPAMLRNSKAQRARMCVLYLVEQGEMGFGPSNRQIAAAIGIAHKGQMSKLLTRLERVGVLTKNSHGAGRPNAWWLTPYGREIAVHFELQESD
jgi:AcrR family transcriptional regulator